MDSVDKSLNYIRDSAKRYAKAKAERIFIERERKVLIAELKNQAELEDPDKYKTDAKQDRYARSHKEYMKLLLNLKAALEIETELHMMIRAAEFNLDIYRTREATKRAEMNLT